MIKLSNSKFLGIFFKLFLLLLVAKGISLVMLFLLPSDGLELNVQSSYQPKFQMLDFSNMLVEEAKKDISKAENDLAKINAPSISNMVLKGLYGTKKSGFIIVALKSSPNKTTIVEVGEIYSGYTLTQIASTNATFVKNAKEYTLWLDIKSEQTNLISSVNDDTNETDEELSQHVVSRSDIDNYAKNPKQIWKEISIKEVKENDVIKGFKVTKIDPKSKMATLGLRKGDLIIKANNVVLKSYKDALDIYTKIKDIDVMQIVVIRNGVEKEIVYEIN